jgi:hypothetical protein
LRRALSSNQELGDISGRLSYEPSCFEEFDSSGKSVCLGRGIAGKDDKEAVRIPLISKHHRNDTMRQAPSGMMVGTGSSTHGGNDCGFEFLSISIATNSSFGSYDLAVDTVSGSTGNSMITRADSVC